MMIMVLIMIMVNTIVMVMMMVNTIVIGMMMVGGLRMWMIMIIHISINVKPCVKGMNIAH